MRILLTMNLPYWGDPRSVNGATQANRRLAEALAAQGARVHAHAFMPLPGTPWAAAPPGEVDPDTAAWLARLEAHGAAHGQWRAQQSS